MTRREKIQNTVFSSLDEINEQLAPDKKMKSDLNTIVFGANAGLDSLGLANLMVLLEETIDKDFGQGISLGEVFFPANGDFELSNLDSLISWIDSNLHGS